MSIQAVACIRTFFLGVLRPPPGVRIDFFFSSELPDTAVLPPKRTKQYAMHYYGIFVLSDSKAACVVVF